MVTTIALALLRRLHILRFYATHIDIGCARLTIHNTHCSQLASMVGRLTALQGSLFSPDRGAKDERACEAAVTRWGGFYGPWLPDTP